MYWLSVLITGLHGYLDMSVANEKFRYALKDKLNFFIVYLIDYKIGFHEKELTQYN